MTDSSVKLNVVEDWMTRMASAASATYCAVDIVEEREMILVKLLNLLRKIDAFEVRHDELGKGIAPLHLKRNVVNTVMTDGFE